MPNHTGQLTIWLIASIGVWTAPHDVHAQCMYEIQLLQDDACMLGGPTDVFGASETGIVVGRDSDCWGDEWYAVYWDEQGDMIFLDFPWDVPESWAYDVNAEQIIVGALKIEGDGMWMHAFLYDGEQYLNLGIPEGANYSKALAINEHGVVAGAWGNTLTGDPASQAFVWADGVLTDLSADLGTPTAEASDINDAGHITGWRGPAYTLEARPYIWRDGEVQDIGLIPGGTWSIGVAINNLGSVVGRGLLYDPYWGKNVLHAFIWIDEEMIDMGTLPGYERSIPYDINDMNQAVGHNMVPGAYRRAFLWQHGEMYDLTDLLPEGSPTFDNAYAINNSGQIAGRAWGSTPTRVTPVDRPEGDADCDCAVGVLDLLMVLRDWSRTDSPPADLNKDGIVDVLDLLLVLQNWE